MDIASFIIHNRDFRNRFEAAMDEPHNERYVIFDGPVNAERYLKSNIKISWVLKEAYEEADGTGGGWSFSDFLDKEDLYNSTFKMPHKATWHPIIYTTFGILNDFILWDDMHYIRDKPQMCDIVRHAAFINTQKLPATGQTRTKYERIEEAYARYHELLHEQIDFINSEVLIFANTFSLYRKKLGLENAKPFIQSSCHSYTKDGKLYIDAYHPAQTTVKRPAYVNDIIQAVQAWQAIQNLNRL